MLAIKIDILTTDLFSLYCNIKRNIIIALAKIKANYPGQGLEKVCHPEQSEDYDEHGDEGRQLGAAANPFAHDAPAQRGGKCNAREERANQISHSLQHILKETLEI
jgi:hypothetical protein